MFDEILNLDSRASSAVATIKTSFWTHCLLKLASGLMLFQVTNLPFEAAAVVVAFAIQCFVSFNNGFNPQISSRRVVVNIATLRTLVDLGVTILADVVGVLAKENFVQWEVEADRTLEKFLGFRSLEIDVLGFGGLSLPRIHFESSFL